MASYNSILRHVSLADVKRNTLKLQEQKRIDEQRRKEELEKIANKNSPLYSDWRFDLSEDMTTQAMTYATTLPAEGDTTLADVTSTEYTLGSGATVIGSTVVLDSNNLPGLFGNAEINTGFIDVSNYTTLKINASKRTVGSREELRLFYRKNSGDSWALFINELYNSQTVDIQSLRGFGEVQFQIRSFYAGGDTPRDYTTWNINSFVFQRRTPITVFVALDSPEATAFVRTGEFGELTNDEKKKKLQDMLNAGDAYLLNKFGDLFPGTGGDYSFTDVNLPPSWEQAGPGYIDSDDAFDNPYYDEPFQDPGDLDDSDDESTWDYAKGDGDTEVAGTNWDLYNWMNKTYGLPAAEWKKNNPTKPDASNPHLPAGSYVPKASKKQQTQVAHYEPDGEVIMDVPSQQLSFSDFRLITVDNVNEDMTVSALTYAATSLEPQGDNVLDSAEGWLHGTAPGATEAYGGVTSDGSTLFLDAGNINIGETGGQLQQAIAQSAGMDTRKFDTARVTVTRTYDAGDETDVRIFGNFFSDPNTFYLLSFFDDNYYPLSGNKGVREFRVGGNRSNAENFKFQVRTTKRKDYDMENFEYIDAPTSRYEVKIELLRKNPISVFVSLDSPEAVSFVRTDEFASLTSEEKKKKLQEMLEAGDAYLLTMYGDPFPGTGADTSFDDVALPESWEAAAGVDVIASIEELFNNFADLFGDASAAAVQLQGYLEWLKDPTPVPTTTQLDDGDKADILNASDEFLGEYFNEDGSPKDYMTDDLMITYISQALQAGIYNSTAATNIHGGIPTSDSKIPIHNDITFNEGISPDGLGGINIIDGYDFPTASQFEIGSSGETIGQVIASGATGVSADEIMGQPRMPIQTNISAYELEGTLLGNVLSYNNVIDVGQPQFEQLIRSRGTIMENKKIKSPKAFFKDKDIKPEFPENPPPPQIKGLHPDLVTGEKTAQRFNRLDPISARAMPRTGIKAIDKKVQIAKKKPK